MTTDLLPLCPSDQLQEGGVAHRFNVRYLREDMTGFVIRYDGAVHAYLNRCGHVPTELDWQPGVVFDAEGLTLVCSVHMAMYDPANGDCIGGPCREFGRARGLMKIECFEQAGMVYWRPSTHIIPITPAA